LVDENLGPVVARWLRRQGHEVFSVYDELRGLDDDSLLQKAFVENWILITNDKDFGEKVYESIVLTRESSCFVSKMSGQPIKLLH
jgi:predicted nuclease of predicted toxin-antitoxin system